MNILANTLVIHGFTKFQIVSVPLALLKECLIFPDMDYVLKIPFTFYGYSREHNACEDEIETYESAKEAGVEKVF